jgi:hypothetical protein
MTFMRIPINDLIYISKVFLLLPVFLWPILTDAVIGEEFRDNTFVNTVTYGVTKLKFYFSKIIVTCIMVFLFIFLMVFFWYISILLSDHNLLYGELLTNFLLSILSALPLYIATVILSAMLNFVLKRSNLSMFFYWGAITTSFFVNIVQQYSNNKPDIIYEVLLTTQLLKLVGPAKMISITSPLVKLTTFGGGITTSEQMITAAFIGAVYIVILLVISSFLNQKWK